MTTTVINEEKFKWPFQEPQEQTARFTVELGMAIPFLQTFPGNVMRWVRINDIPYLPECRYQLRERLLFGANLWVTKLLHSKDKYHLVTQEANILVAGPYHTYHYQAPTSAKSIVGHGLRSEEVGDPNACDFRLKALFVPEYGHRGMFETERPNWTIKVDGPTNTNTEDPSGGRARLRRLGSGGMSY